MRYAAAKSSQVAKVVKEGGSGANDARPTFLALLEDMSIGVILVEQKDLATRFGFRSPNTLLRVQGRGIEVVTRAEHETEDLLADLTSIMYSVCARLYGQRRASRTTEAIIKQLDILLLKIFYEKDSKSPTRLEAHGLKAVS